MSRIASRPSHRAILCSASAGVLAAVRDLAVAAVATSATLLAPGIASAASAPYPASTAIPGIAFDWATHRRLAPGSDNWPLTWSADGDQYAAFGDGGGFGGTNIQGRVSLGVARIEGEASDYEGSNVWGGLGPEAGATFNGKSRGLLAIGTDLYMWRCGNGSRQAAFRFQQIYKSTNSGRTWQPAPWVFPGTLTFFCPAFVQFGRGYEGARDDYVYMHASERDNETWEAHTPGRVMLMRAPRGRLMDRAAYEFFAGRDGSGQPRWSVRVDDREPVFTDPNGARLPAVTYNPGLRRYLLAVEQAPKGSSNIGIFDAPEPWGPWTTVLYERGWGRGRIDTTAFYYNFAPKWWSDDGTNFVLVFTGSGELDSWNSVEGSLAVGPAVGGGDNDDDGTDGATVADGAGADTKEDESASTTVAATRVAGDPAASGNAGTAKSADTSTPRVAGTSLRATTAPSTTAAGTASATRSARRNIFTSTDGSSSAAGAVGADVPAAASTTASTSRAAVRSGGRDGASAAGSAVAARATAEPSATVRQAQADASASDDGTRSTSATEDATAATGTASDVAQDVDADAAETAGSGRQTGGIVISSGGSANRTRDAATASGSRTAATSGGTAPSTATSSAATPRATAAAATAGTSSPTGSSRTGAGSAAERSDVADREDVDVLGTPAPAPARPSGSAAPRLATAAGPAGRDADAAIEAATPDPDGPAVDAGTLVAADDPAALDVPPPASGAPASGPASLGGDPRLVGVMERGTVRMALVVPPDASQPVAVRVGDTVGPWSVEGVDGQEVALRAGERTLVLRLFAIGGRAAAGDAG